MSSFSSGFGSGVNVSGTGTDRRGSTASSGSSTKSRSSTTDAIIRAIQNLAKKGEPSRAKKVKHVAILERARAKALQRERLENRATWEERCSAERIQAQANFEKLMITDPGYHVPIRRILSHIKDSKERAMLSNMSQVWADILMPYGPTFLFHAVLPILHLQNVLSVRDLKEIRGTCKEWRDSLDAHLRALYTSEDFTWKLQWPLMTPTSRSGEVLEVHFPKMPYDPAEFVEWCDRMMDERAENPFISGKVRFELTPEMTGHEEFHDRLYATLRRWGSRMLHVTIVLHHFGLWATYEAVHSYLRFLPETKFLLLSSVEPRAANFLDILLLQGTMIGRALPKMPKLTHLHLSSMPSEILNKMMDQYGDKLESLIIDGVGEEPEWSQGPEPEGRPVFPRLKQYKNTTDASLIMQEEEPSPSWPLEEMEWRFTNVEANTVPYIFRIHAPFWKTLRKLTITLEREVEDGPVVKLDRRTQQMLSLDLPRVEEFTLCASGINLATMDFILPMERLKLLDVTYVKYVEDFGVRPATATSTTAPNSAQQQQQTDHIIQYNDQLQESNIWRLFPQLRKVTHTIIHKLKEEVQEREELEELRRRHPTVKIEECEGEWGTVKQKVYTREQYEQNRMGTLL